MELSSILSPSQLSSTLILPSLGIANIGQLAIDVLLYNSLHHSFLSYVQSPHLYPFSGPSIQIPSSISSPHEYSLALPLELHNIAVPLSSPHLDCNNNDISSNSNALQRHVCNVNVLQIRSPPLPGHWQQFVDELSAFIKAHGFTRVILIASADASMRLDDLLNIPKEKSDCKVIMNVAESPCIIQIVNDATKINPLPSYDGSGITNRLLSSLSLPIDGNIDMGENNRNAMFEGSIDLIVAHTIEGNNIPECVQILRLLCGRDMKIHLPEYLDVLN